LAAAFRQTDGRVAGRGFAVPIAALVEHQADHIRIDVFGCRCPHQWCIAGQRRWSIRITPNIQEQAHGVDSFATGGVEQSRMKLLRIFCGAGIDEQL